MLITRKKYALRFFIRPLDFSLEIYEKDLSVQESLEQTVEVV